MILFLLVSIAIPFLSLPALFAGVLYLPILLWIARIPLRTLRRAWLYILVFALLLYGLHGVRALYRQGPLFRPAELLDTTGVLLAYGLFLSLGSFLLNRVPAAQLQQSLQGILPPLPGFIRVGAIAGLAASLLTRLRGIGSAVSDAIKLRSGGRYRLRSGQDAATAMVRLTTELALGTGDALILRGYDPSIRLPRTVFQERAPRLLPELLPLLLLAAVDTAVQLQIIPLVY